MQLSYIQRVEHCDIEHRIADRDIYFLQHYLVESLARCTSKINQWKIICSKNTQRKNFDIKKQEDDKIIEVAFKSEHYGKTEKRFDDLLNTEDEVKECKIKSFAKTVIEQNR